MNIEPRTQSLQHNSMDLLTTTSTTTNNNGDQQHLQHTSSSSSSVYVTAESSPESSSSSSSRTTVVNNLDSLQSMNMVADEYKEFQSLPNFNRVETSIKKEMSESNISDLNSSVSSIISQTVSTQLSAEEEKPKQKQRSAAFSFLEKILSKTSPNSQRTVPSVQQSVQVTDTTTTASKLAALNDKHIESYDKLNSLGSASLLSNTAAAASASSPNPECSPYKLLTSEIAKRKETSDLLHTHQEKEEVEKKQHESISSMPLKDCKLIESLCEKIDPMVEAKTCNNTISSVNVATVGGGGGGVSSSTMQEHVPASSREFCMNLNFNLAAAAAATAAGPVVVIDNTSSSSSDDHNRFTSNASTSSIHNDLKMILEESKENSNTNSTITTKQEPKPQRVSNKSNNNITKSNVNVNTDEQEQQSKSHTDSLNLIKIMMLMVESSKADKAKVSLETGAEPVLIDWNKQSNNGRYRYTKEFLTQIKEQRANFIDQIYPDIFKAYCYCMNGKYWDPEKYFDIGEYDKIPSRNYNQKSAAYTKKYTPDSSFNQHKQSKHQHQLKLKTPILNNNDQLDASPQPLQVPKNSPKTFVFNPEQSGKHSHQRTGKENKKSILNSLGLNTSSNPEQSDADKLLLGLIKKEQPNTKKQEPIDLLAMINKDKKISQDLKKSNIIESLFPAQSKSKSKTKPETTTGVPKHYPLILTAEELEMSQLNQQKKQRNKLPVNHNEITFGTHNNISEQSANTSDAYKQLVKNLSNHPLISLTNAMNNKAATATGESDDVFSKKSNKKHKQKTNKPSWQVSNDGTQVLKQLLNLNSVSADIKKSKTKKTKRHQQKNSNSSSCSSNAANKSISSVECSTSSCSSSEAVKFPSMNPHEKPFENLIGEENRKQIEKVVTNALNKVLNKSPLSNGSKSPIDNLLAKINQDHQTKQKSPSEKKKSNSKKQENEHFNSLLNKIMPAAAPIVQAEKANDSDILKWFSNSSIKMNSQPTTGHFSITTLSEIELMQSHRSTALEQQQFL